MSRIENTTQNVDTNNVQSAQSTQQASQADNKNIQDFNRLLNSKKDDPSTLSLLKKSEKMLAHKLSIPIVQGKEGEAKDQKFAPQMPQQDIPTTKQKSVMPEDSFTTKQKSESMPQAESLFASINQNIPQTQNTQPTTQTQATQPAQFDASKIQELADRILVATNKDGSNEVRLMLSDKALAGTEVIITKSLDNQLTVRFETVNANSFQTLVAAQDTLKSTLESQNSNVRVEVTQDKQDSQGESRGKREYNPFEDEQEA